MRHETWVERLWERHGVHRVCRVSKQNKVRLETLKPRLSCWLHYTRSVLSAVCMKSSYSIGQFDWFTRFTILHETWQLYFLYLRWSFNLCIPQFLVDIWRSVWFLVKNTRHHPTMWRRLNSDKCGIDLGGLFGFISRSLLGHWQCHLCYSAIDCNLWLL